MAEAEDRNSVMHDDVIINVSAACMDRATKKGRPHRLQDFRAFSALSGAHADVLGHRHTSRNIARWGRAYMHQDHGSCDQGQGVDSQPGSVPLRHKGPDVCELPNSLNHGGRQRQQLLVQLKPCSALYQCVELVAAKAE